MNYHETLDYLFSRLPMYQRIGSAAYKANLDNTIALCKLLNNPERNFKSVHIGGTNGKGSTSHMLASILQTAGYKVGLYTSPHLKDFRERIKTNGEMIPENEVIEFVEDIIVPAKENNLDLSFFEMTVGLAFNYFAKENVDIAIIEVGLGGRLDSTNVIAPLLSIITNISFDHTSLLGNTLKLIAKEKAGIIKYETPVIIGEMQEEVKSVFENKAKENNCEIRFADKTYQAKNVTHVNNGKQLLKMDFTRKGNTVLSNLESELIGLYQQKNIPAVLCAVDELRRKDFFIPEISVRNGIKNVIKNTGLLGRWQILGSNPLVMADTGHNEAGIKEVLFHITQTPHKQLHFVLGVVNDKDVASMLNLLPKDARYYFCKANIPRGLNADELASLASTHNLRGEVYPSVKSAMEAAISIASADDLVFIGGSTFTVAEVV